MKFTTDNAGISIVVPADQLEILITEACGNLFGWRSSTRHYDSMVARWQAQGSVKYDKVIEYLYDCGYTTDKELIQ